MIIPWYWDKYHVYCMHITIRVPYAIYTVFIRLAHGIYMVERYLKKYRNHSRTFQHF